MYIQKKAAKRLADKERRDARALQKAARIQAEKDAYARLKAIAARTPAEQAELERYETAEKLDAEEEELALQRAGFEYEQKQLSRKIKELDRQQRVLRDKIKTADKHALLSLARKLDGFEAVFNGTNDDASGVVVHVGGASKAELPDEFIRSAQDYFNRRAGRYAIVDQFIQSDPETAKTILTWMLNDHKPPLVMGKTSRNSVLRDLRKRMVPELR